jgi:iron complex transport system substrate-binding protein
VAWEVANWYTGSTYGITEVTLDQLAAWDPEIIYCPAGARYAVSDILNDPAWQSLRAVRNGKVFQLLSRPRSSLGGCLSVAWIVNNIYPERYTDEQRSADAKRFYAFDYRS